MELRVLGDVEAWIGDQRIGVGHARQQCVLAVLVMEANRIVTVDQLLEWVWSQPSPQRRRQVLRTYLSRLRRLLTPGGVAIERRPNGYVLLADPDMITIEAAITTGLGACALFVAGVQTAQMVFENALDSNKAKLERLTTTNSAEGIWPAPTTDFSDASVLDEDKKSDWEPIF